MNLYEIKADYLAIIECEDQFAPEDFQAALAAVVESEHDKLCNIAGLIKNLKAEGEALKAEAARLSARAKAKENHVDRLKQYVLDYIGDQKWKSQDALHGFSKRKSPQPKLIYDIEQLPEQYISYEPKAETKEIKKDLASGSTIPGASLEQGYYLKVD
jgi:hypothetical protein